MKKTSLILVLVLSFAGISFAQNKNTGRADIATPGVQCEKCKSRIENFMKREYGVTSVKVDLKRKMTLVTWIPDRSNIENVKTAIANLGYDADDVTAEETAYKRLPPCCKKPAEENIKN